MRKLILLFLLVMVGGVYGFELSLHQVPEELICDTQIREGQPNSSTSTTTTTHCIEDHAGAFDRFILEKFNISELPNNITIDFANLTMFIRHNALDSLSEGYNVSTHYIFSNYTWEDGNITWNTAPHNASHNRTATDFINITNNTIGWIGWDVTQIVSDGYQAGTGNLSIFIIPNSHYGSTNDLICFGNDRTWLSNKTIVPYLNITYSAAITRKPLVENFTTTPSSPEDYEEVNLTADVVQSPWSLDTVLFEVNDSDVFTNYSASGNHGNTYYYYYPSSELNASETIAWRAIANNTMSQWNDSSAYTTFTVQGTVGTANLNVSSSNSIWSPSGYDNDDTFTNDYNIRNIGDGNATGINLTITGSSTPTGAFNYSNFTLLNGTEVSVRLTFDSLAVGDYCTGGSGCTIEIDYAINSTTTTTNRQMKIAQFSIASKPPVSGGGSRTTVPGEKREVDVGLTSSKAVFDFTFMFVPNEESRTTIITNTGDYPISQAQWGVSSRIAPYIKRVEICNIDGTDCTHGDAGKALMMDIAPGQRKLLIMTVKVDESLTTTYQGDFALIDSQDNTILNIPTSIGRFPVLNNMAQFIKAGLNVSDRTATGFAGLGLMVIVALAALAGAV